MNRLHQFTTLSLILVITLACNLPGTASQPSLSVNDEAATIIAATLQEQVKNGGDVPITATFSPIPQATSTTGATATITPTYSVPMLTLLEPTNCRLGPGQDYAVLFSYVKGAKLEIIGAYPQLNYWLVKSEESGTGQCWLWGEYADITGSYWAVPSVTPPPTPTMTLPQAPSIKWEFNCDYNAGQMITTFTWKDLATNEDGYHIVRDGQVIIELPANTTSYTDSYIFTVGVKVNYQIQVYNVTGFTRSAVASVTC